MAKKYNFFSFLSSKNFENEKNNRPIVVKDVKNRYTCPLSVKIPINVFHKIKPKEPVHNRDLK
jgi:hypothetical protein